MSHARASKQELKRQRDALGRFERYLPTLQLKKRQLQMEVRRVEAQEREALAGLEAATAGLDPWIALFSDDLHVEAHVRLSALDLGEANIAGINVPVLRGVAFARAAPDLHATPPFLDEAVAAVEELLRPPLQVRTLARQRELLERELRITSQRVNLFEKGKIPAAERTIRTIRIALGDQQAAEVVRAKIAKGKASEQELAA